MLTVTVNDNWSVSIEAQAAPPGIFSDTVDIADPTDVAIPTGVTATAFIEKIQDGTSIAGFTIGWGDTVTTNTDLRYRKAEDTQWIFLNSPESPIRVAPLPPSDFEYQLRHVSRENISSNWTAAAAVIVEGDQIPPADPENFTITSLPAGYQATWTASPDTDYHHTEVYDAATGTAFTDATLRATRAGSSYSRPGLATDTLDVWIRHIDTWGNASGEVKATVTPGEQAQGIAGLSVAELIVFRKATVTETASALGGGVALPLPTATNYDFATSTFTGLASPWSLVSRPRNN